MKKFVSLCAFVAALSFVSCGGNTAATAVDSAAIADSLAKVAADSAAAAAAAAVDTTVVDSAAVAVDSAAAAVAQ